MNQIFPYPMRPQQHTLMEFIGDNLKLNSHLVFEAANGTGKTIVALSAALEYKQKLGIDGEAYKILVLSRTNSQADRVIDELLKMKGKYSALAKRGKESMCNNPEVNISSKIPFQSRCEKAVKLKKCTYYYRIKRPSKSLGLDEIRNSLLSLPMYSHDVIYEADNIGVCAAELANSLVPDVDIISGSYLYLFDPEIQFGFQKMLGVELNKIILVIDECHNLPNIVFNACEYNLSEYQINRAKKEMKGFDLKFVEVLEALIINQQTNKIISSEDFLDKLDQKLSIVHTDSHEDENHVYHVIKHLSEAVKKYKTKSKASFAYSEQIIHFLANLYNEADKPYRVILKEIVGKQFLIKFSLLDPSKNISAILKQVHCSISMSGSLNLLSYLSLTGIKFLDHESLILPSPYDQNNIKIVVTRGLSTKYNQRVPSTYQQMSALVKTLMHQKRNTGLFLPSYGVLNELRQHDLGSLKVFESKGDMTSEETDEMILKFKEEKGALLISVMGGRSSEGTDFKGDSMEVVVIAGIPFGMPDTLTDARIKYFDAISNNGWNLIYLARALQQLSQAAGRPLRSLEDRVFILIMDERVLKYQTQFPSWMHCFEPINPNTRELEVHIKKFYS